MSKRCSTIRKENYEALFMQFKAKDTTYQMSNVRVYKGVQYFCMYLVNYTTITSIEAIDKKCIERFLKYLVENRRRLDVDLKDIKKTVMVIQEMVNISSSPVIDFSVSNVALWSNLK